MNMNLISMVIVPLMVALIPVFPWHSLWLQWRELRARGAGQDMAERQILIGGLIRGAGEAVGIALSLALGASMLLVLIFGRSAWAGWLVNLWIVVMGLCGILGGLPVLYAARWYNMERWRKYIATFLGTMLILVSGWLLIIGIQHMVVWRLTGAWPVSP